MSVEFDGGLPESSTQGLLTGKLLVGGLEVLVLGVRSTFVRPTTAFPAVMVMKNLGSKTINK